MKIQFNYYLHDNSSFGERASFIHDQISSQVQMSEDELGELIGRPFYEVKMECELDTVTGQVSILKATT